MYISITSYADWGKTRENLKFVNKEKTFHTKALYRSFNLICKNITEE